MPNYNYNRYMYETSPRKLKPEYDPPRERKRKKSSTLKRKKEEKVKVQIKKRKAKAVLYLIMAFSVLFAIGYQNSKINEEFSKYKNSEEKLATIQKENEQLKVTIENNLNLNNVEQMAKEQLGMQQATTQQTRYVNLPKKDYVEVASEHIERSPNQNVLQNLIQAMEKIVR